MYAFGILVVISLGGSRVACEEGYKKALDDTLQVKKAFENIKPEDYQCEVDKTDLLVEQSYRHNANFTLMLDATAKLQSGVLAGNRANLGDFDECLAIEHDVETDSVDFHTIHGKYCLGNITFHKDFLQTVHYNRTDSISSKWAMCIPHLCSSTGSLNSFADFYIKTFMLSSKLYNITVDFDPDMCQWNDPNSGLSGGAIFAVILFTTLLIIILLSTGYDLYCHHTNTEPLSEYATVFSVYSNGINLLSTANPEQQFTCVDGLRFVSILWIILGNRHNLTKYTPQVVGNTANIEKWQDSWYNRYADGYTYGIDTFLVINAILTVYNFMDNKERGETFRVHMHYFQRLIRYTPSLAAFVLFCATLLPYISSGPEYPIFLQKNQEVCQSRWWATLFYMHNYVLSDEMCVSQSWYLDVDMQLHLLSPLLLIPLGKWPNYTLNGLMILSVALVSALFVTAWNSGLHGVLPRNFNWATYWSQYYVVTHTRCLPWFVGAVIGYYIFKLKNRQQGFSMAPKMYYPLWTIALIVMFNCVFISQNFLSNDYTHPAVLNSLYITLSRPLWAASVGWIIFTCIMGFGGFVNKFLSMDIFQVLAKFSLNMYLIHETFIQLTIYSRRTHLFYNNTSMFYYGCGDIFMSFIVAFIWVLAFEAPFVKLGKILTPLNWRPNEHRPVAEAENPLNEDIAMDQL